MPFVRGSVVDFGCGVGALAEHISCDRYVGVDKDSEIIDIARKSYPSHTFYTLEEFEESRGKFDTVVALAVIEHVDSVQDFMAQLKSLLMPKGIIVITTPHKSSRFIYRVGARLGLFSRAAEQEHKALFDARAMAGIAGEAGLELVEYRRFLFLLNQLIVLALGPDL